jgi:hypothetical protein
MKRRVGPDPRFCFVEPFHSPILLTEAGEEKGRRRR